MVTAAVRRDRRDLYSSCGGVAAASDWRRGKGKPRGKPPSYQDVWKHGGWKANNDRVPDGGDRSLVTLVVQL